MELQVNRKRQELRALNAEIAERELYHREQKAVINEMIERGNSRLIELHHDILFAEKELRDIKTDLRTAIQDKVLLLQDLEELRVEASQITVIHFPGMANGF